jgi:hypothetical protein
MIVKKTKIISLALIILLSTSGIPFSYHLCESLGAFFQSDCETVCYDCNLIKDFIPSCCSLEENSVFEYTIKSQDKSCCKDEFIFQKVSDLFINKKFESLNNNFNKHNFIIPLIISEIKSSYSLKNFANNPLKIPLSKDLNIFYSILLI